MGNTSKTATTLTKFTSKMRALSSVSTPSIALTIHMWEERQKINKHDPMVILNDDVIDVGITSRKPVSRYSNIYTETHSTEGRKCQATTLK